MPEEAQRLTESLRELNADFRTILTELQKLDRRLRQLAKEVEG